MEALFLVFQGTSILFKQPQCPSAEEWVKKMWYIHTRGYYSVIKRNETESFVDE